MPKKNNPLTPSIVATFLLIFLSTPSVAQPDGKTERPNILWISVEDVSPHIGAYGDKVARTPNIDQLARDGVKYTRAFTTAGVCAPSRSAIITGMYQTSIGTHHMRTSHAAEGLPTPYSAVPPPYVKAFTEYLRAAGYYTTNNVKTDYQFASIRNPREPLTAWDESSRQAHWRNRPDKNQPFFSVINLTMTHESQNWPNLGREAVTDPATVEVPPYYPDTPAVRAELGRLHDNIARMDARVGEILQQLENDGLAENTVVFFWSDHGDGLPRAKRWLYDSGLHVPLIVRWPGQIEKNSENDDLINFVDLAPTVLSIADVPVPQHMQGRAFLGKQKASPRDYIFAARDRHDEAYDMVRAVRDKKFKYIRNFYPHKPYVLWIPYRNRCATMQELLRLHAEDKLEGAQKLWLRNQRPPEELYDLEADPHEINNLADDPNFVQTLEKMRRVLENWREETGDMGDIPEAEMVAQMWPNGKQPQTAKPMIIVNADGNRNATASAGSDTIFAPATISLSTPTQGASIAYSTDSGENPHWRLYAGPIRLSPGRTNLRTRAVRYGYQESEEASVTLTVKSK